MSKKCINRKCVLLNLAYNLALNNILGGISSIFHADIDQITVGSILIGLAFLLIIGLRKEDRSITLTFLIMESFVLTSKLIEATIHFVNNENLNILKILSFCGTIVSCLLLVPVYILFRDFGKTNTVQEEDEAKNVTI